MGGVGGALGAGVLSIARKSRNDSAAEPLLCGNLQQGSTQEQQATAPSVTSPSPSPGPSSNTARHARTAHVAARSPALLTRGASAASTPPPAPDDAAGGRACAPSCSSRRLLSPRAGSHSASAPHRTASTQGSTSVLNDSPPSWRGSGSVEGGGGGAFMIG